MRNMRARQIAKRTCAVFEARNELFGQEHAEDTDEQLLELVRQKAQELGRSPHPLDLEGGYYIESRLGEWNTILTDRLGLEPISHPAQMKKHPAYKAEYPRQEAIYNRRREEKREKAQQRAQLEQARKAAWKHETEAGEAAPKANTEEVTQ